MLCFGWEWAQTAGPATAIATRRTLSLCSFLEKGKKENRYAPHAEKLRAEAKVQVEEVEAAVASLRGAIAAFKAAEVKGFEENGVIDEGFGVRALKESFKEFGISVQRYWNGAVSLP